MNKIIPSGNHAINPMRPNATVTDVGINMIAIQGIGNIAQIANSNPILLPYNRMCSKNTVLILYIVSSLLSNLYPLYKEQETNTNVEMAK